MIEFLIVLYQTLLNKLGYTDKLNDIKGKDLSFLPPVLMALSISIVGSIMTGLSGVYLAGYFLMAMVVSFMGYTMTFREMMTNGMARTVTKSAMIALPLGIFPMMFNVGLWMASVKVMEHFNLEKYEPYVMGFVTGLTIVLTLNMMVFV